MSAVVDREPVDLECGNSLEAASALAIEHDCRVGEVDLGEALRRCGMPERYESLGIRQRQWGQDDRIDHTKYSCRCADAEGQCQQSGDGERRGLRERADRVPRLTKEALQGHQPPAVTCPFLHAREI